MCICDQARWGNPWSVPWKLRSCAYGPQYRHFYANTSRQGKGTVDKGMRLVARTFGITKNRYYHITFKHTLTQKVFLYLDANTSHSSLCLGFQESWQRVCGYKQNTTAVPSESRLHRCTNLQNSDFELGSAKIPGDSISLCGA